MWKKKPYTYTHFCGLCSFVCCPKIRQIPAIERARGCERRRFKKKKEIPSLVFPYDPLKLLKNVPCVY